MITGTGFWFSERIKKPVLVTSIETLLKLRFRWIAPVGPASKAIKAEFFLAEYILLIILKIPVESDIYFPANFIK